MRRALVAILVLHGLIHVAGFAHAFDLAEVALSAPITPALGVVWLLAALALLATAVWLRAAPRTWWVGGLAAVVLSQTAIGFAWSDARLGTAVNALVLLAVIHGFASEGPGSLRARYRSQVAARLAALADEPARPIVGEDVLAGLPEPLGAYLRRSGAAGRPRPRHFTARWKGRIRSAPDAPWMEFVAEQHNFTDEPSRFFLLDARRAGIPVDVLHAYVAGEATMRAKVLSLFPIIDQEGADLGRAETVTVLNDLALLAPGGLADSSIRWDPVDAHSVRGTFTVGSVEVSAVLRFDDDGDLVDFVSDDRRRASADGRELVPERWSTPVGAYRSFGPWRAPTRGEGRWHPPEGGWSYVEIELLDLHIDGAPAEKTDGAAARKADPRSA